MALFGNVHNLQSKNVCNFLQEMCQQYCFSLLEEKKEKRKLHTRPSVRFINKSWNSHSIEECYTAFKINKLMEGSRRLHLGKHNVE